MKSKISTHIFLYPENKNEEKIIKFILEESLIYPNPKFDDMVSLGFSTRGIPKFLKTYDFIKDLYFKIPKGCFDVYEHIKSKVQLTEEDIEQNEGSEINFKCKFKLRDVEQQKAVDSFINNKNGYGILSLPCGLT